MKTRTVIRVEDGDRADTHLRKLLLLAEKLTCWSHPIHELRFIELFVLADVEIPHLIMLRLPGGYWAKRRASEEGDSQMLGEAMLKVVASIQRDGLDVAG